MIGNQILNEAKIEQQKLISIINEKNLEINELKSILRENELIRKENEMVKKQLEVCNQEYHNLKLVNSQYLPSYQSENSSNLLFYL